MYLIGSLSLLILLIIIPLIFGLPWTYYCKFDGRVAILGYSYVMGFFVMLSMFTLVLVPLAIFNVTFKVLCIVYSLFLIITFSVSVLYIKKYKVLNIFSECKRSKWSNWDLLYLIIFIGLFLVQIFYAFFYSRTVMADDGYIAFSASAISDNYINLTNVSNGLYLAKNAEWIRRTIQTINFFPAYLSYISSLKPIIIDHSIMYVIVDFLAYASYVVLADKMFKRKDNKLLFLIFVEILYIWGLHSNYSMTFRLLGPNSEGKAILAVVLAPFMLGTMHYVVENGYKSYAGFQLLVLSISACSLSLGGVYTTIAILISMVLISAITNRSYKVLLYLLWGGLIPTVFAGVYLYYRYRWG